MTSGAAPPGDLAAAPPPAAAPPAAAPPAAAPPAAGGVGRLAVALRGRLGPTTWLFVVAALVGAGAGAAAIALHEAIAAVQWVAFGTASRAGPLEALLGRHDAATTLRLLLAPALGGLAVGLLARRLLADAPGHGVPGVLHAVRERGGRIEARHGLAAAGASAVTLGAGLSLGREGPVVHFGAAVASILARALVPTAREARVLAACGAAAGLAAVFDAPLGGAAFALEVIVGGFALEACGPVLVAATVATALARAWRPPIVSVPPYALAGAAELLGYAGLGLAAGAVAAAQVRGIAGALALVRRLRVPAWLGPALAGLVVGVVALGATPRVLGNGYETVDALLRGQALEVSLVALLVLKLALTSLCAGAGGVGGLFGPSVFLGAVLGAGVGRAVHAVAPSAQPGAYALVGMAAVVAGATHAPVSMVLLCFELTGDYGMVLPLLVGTSVASTVARRLFAESIDTVADAARGRDVVTGAGPSALDVVRVGDVARPAPDALVPPGAPLPRVLDAFLRARTDVVVVGDGRVEGVVLLDDVQAAVAAAGVAGRLVIAHDVARDDVPRLAPDDPLARALEAFRDGRWGALPVVDPATGTYVGLLDQRPLMTAYRGERLRAELAGAAGGQVLDLDPGVTLARVPAPAWLVGRSLADADLRRRTGVQVVTVRAPGRDTVRLPDPRAAIAPGTTLVVVGPPAAVAALGDGPPPPP